jgi:hypothetical protein
LAKELFKEDSNSNKLSSNKKDNQQYNNDCKKSFDFDSEEEGVVLGDLPECSGLVDFIDKTLTLSNQNIIQALSGNFDNKHDGEEYSISFHEMLESFKYDCHVINEQLSGVKETIGKFFFIQEFNFPNTLA